MDTILYWLKNPFTGRLTRTKYWWYGMAVNTGFKILDKMDGFLALIVFLILWFVDLSFYIRRLHDFNRSGWFLMIPISAIAILLLTMFSKSFDSSIVFVTMVLIIIFFKLFLISTEGTPGPNKYGENPRLDKNGLPKNRLNHPQ